MKRKWWNALSVAAICLTMALGVEAHAAAVPFFEDVTSRDWYYEDVRTIAAAGYMQGVDRETFAPAKEVTRGMFVTVLGRIAAAPGSVGTNRFSDVKEGSWYAPYVNWAAEKGIASGISGTSFAPQQPITREEAALMLAKYLKAERIEVEREGVSAGFLDKESASQYARSALDMMCRSGIMQGDTAGNFRPKDRITRAEAAAVFARLLDVAKIETAVQVRYLPDLSYILHAGGQIDGFAGGNVLEGLEQSYQAGSRVVEIDFNFTADGYLACIHDWNRRFPSTLDGKVEAPALQEFLDVPVYGRYTPLWAGSLGEFMRSHPELYVVTDVKDENIRAAAVIREYCPDLMDRFIIQIYRESECAPIRELGFEHIIYTLYALPWKEKMDTAHLAEFARDHELLGYTFADVLCQREGYVEEMKRTGVPLYIHTVNDPQLQEEFFKMGISGIYTDYAQ